MKKIYQYFKANVVTLVLLIGVSGISLFAAASLRNEINFSGLLNCTIGEVEIEGGSCQGADFVFEVAYEVENGSGNYEVIDNVSGMQLATGSDSPIPVRLLDNTRDDLLEIVVRDTADPNCTSTPSQIQLARCVINPNCSIGEVEIEGGNCQGADFVFEVAYEVEEGTGTYEIVNVDTDEVLATGTDSPIPVVIVGNMSDETINIVVRDAGNPTCQSPISTITLTPCDLPVVTCFTDTCGFFNPVPVELNDNGDNWVCNNGIYSVNAFRGFNTIDPSELWLVSNALEYDNANSVNFNFEIIQQGQSFGGAPIRIFFAQDYAYGQCPEDIEETNWQLLRAFNNTPRAVSIPLDNIDGVFYIGIQYTAQGNAGGTPNYFLSDLRIEADDCDSVTPMNCSISGVDFTLGDCNDQGTPAAADDLFEAVFNVSFDGAPTTGTLNLTGGANASIPVEDLDSDMGHQFVTQLPSNGEDIKPIVAFFSDDPFCPFRIDSVGIAPPPCSSFEDCETPFFSKYGEQNIGNNRAIEIYNPTSDTVDLAAENYVLALYFNGIGGVENPNSTVALTGKIAPLCTYVIVNTIASDPDLQAKADQNASINFNGNDALVLWRNGLDGDILDVFGRVGENPNGGFWTGLGSRLNLISSDEDVLVRDSFIQAGDVVPNDDFFGDNTGWYTVGSGNFDVFGTHQNECAICDLAFNNFSTSDESCAGLNDGRIEIDATASFPIQYSIDGGVTFQSSNIFENVAPGNYDIVLEIPKVENCRILTSATINAGPALTIDDITSTDEVCPNDADGTITITASFQGATLLYSIDGGNTFQADNIFTGLADGNYEIVVATENNLGCQANGGFITIQAGIDDTAPTFDCPSDLTVNTDAGVCTAMVNNIGVTNISDFCDAAPVVAFELTGATTAIGIGDVSGTNFELGITTVTYTVTDKNGNAASCSFNIIVEDNELPMFDQCPSDIIITNATDFYCNTEGIVRWTPPVFSDNCTDNLILNNNLDPDFVPDLGFTPVIYTAEDESGNIATCAFDIVLQDIYITEACVCLDNRLGNQLGQLAEQITVYSAPGEDWRITAVNGFYQLPTAAFPPLPNRRYDLNPFVAGARLTEQPAGSGLYILEGFHEETIGYSITVSNGSTTFSTSNLCDYDIACAGDIIIPSTGGGTVTYDITCGETTDFFDDGGTTHPYSDEQAQTNVLVACPDNPITQTLRITFNQFDVAAGDTLFIFDGENGTGTLLASSSGSSVADAAQGGWTQASCENETGCLTFKFMRNGDNIKGAGWEAKFDCVPRESEFICPINSEYTFIGDECGKVENVIIDLPTVNTCGNLVEPVITFECETPDFTVDLINGTLTIEHLPIGIHHITFANPVFEEQFCTAKITVTPTTLTCNDALNVSLSQDCQVALTLDMLLEAPCPEINAEYEITFNDDAVAITGATVGGYPIVDLSGLQCGAILDIKIERTINASCGDVQKDACWGQIILEDKTPPVLIGLDDPLDIIDEDTIFCFYDTPDLLTELNQVKRDGRGVVIELKPRQVEDVLAINDQLVIEAVFDAYAIEENCSAGFQCGEWFPVDFDCETNGFDLNVSADDPLWDLMQIEVEEPNDAARRAVFRTYIRTIFAVDDCGNTSNIGIQKIVVVQADIVSPLPEIQLPCKADPDPIAIYEAWANDPIRFAEYATFLPNYDRTPLNVNGDDGAFAGLDDTYFTDNSGDEIPAIPDHVDCGYAISWNDGEPIDVCGESFKIFREWTVYNWCDGHLELLDLIPQVVKVGDSDAPSLEFLGFAGVPTNTQECTSDAIIQVAIEDDCSGNIRAYVDFEADGVGEAEFELIDGTIRVPNIAIGEQVIFSIRLIDDCGNTATFGPFDPVLEDNIAPVMICESFHTISYDKDCKAQVLASVFDDGSYDNCGTITLDVARLEDTERDDDGDGIGLEDSDFADFVEFSEADLVEACLGRAKVVLRATDLKGNSSLCMVDVELQDKTAPVASDMPLFNTTCFTDIPATLTGLLVLKGGRQEQLDSFSTLLNSGLFGQQPEILESCSDFDVEVVDFDFSEYDPLCNEGLISYKFQATDVCGFKSNIAHGQIFVDGDFHDWEMLFPRDRFLDCSDRFIRFRIPDPEPLEDILIRNNGCDEWTLNVDIKRSDASIDACYQFIYTYELINWCTWDPRNTVPAIVERQDTTLLEERFERVRLVYQDAFLNTAINGGVELNNFDCDEIISPPGRDGINDIDDFCDDDFYFTSNAGFDADFVLTGVDTSQITDDIDIFVVRGFEDEGELDSTRTYVSAQQYGYITYNQIIRVYDVVAPFFEVETLPEVFCAEGEAAPGNNCTAPVAINFAIGDACAEIEELDLSYQLKPFNGVAIDDPFGAIEDLGDGNLRIVGNYPLGNNGDTAHHTLILTLMDACFNTEVIEIPFKVADCKAPTPYCIFGVSAELMQTGEVELWASDFDRGSFDNCTPPDSLRLTFADPDLYPDSTSRTFRCDAGELGVIPVELWVQDLVGNKAFCETFVEIQDNRGTICPSIDPMVASGVILTAQIDPVEGVDVHLNAAVPRMKHTTISGEYLFVQLEAGEDFSIVPDKNDDPLNGVSTFDLVLISKHILGTELLDSPYQLIAADINNSGSITTFDLVELRKLILNINTAFQSNTSWRFVPSDYTFTNPANPFQDNFPEIISINDFEGLEQDLDFVAIKVGDVNGTVVANANQVEGRKDVQELAVEAIPTELDEQTVRLDFTTDLSRLEGMQFTIEYAPAQVTLLEFLPQAVTGQQVGLLQDGIITLSWNGESTADDLFGLKFKANKTINWEAAITITSAKTAAEAYHKDGRLLAPKLQVLDKKMTGFELFQNIPNPVKSNTIIPFYLPMEETVILEIRDVNGKLLYTTTQRFGAGQQQIEIENKQLQSGVLTYSILTPSFAASRKMTVLD